MLLCVAFGSFAGDFGVSAGIPTIAVQGAEWNMSPVVVNYANNLAVAMLALGSVLWMPLLNCWGRMPLLFWSTILGMLFTLGAALSQDFPTFYGMRALQCCFQPLGQVIGLVLIEDIFFFHEQARKIGIWFSIFICSPFLTPLLGNFMVPRLGEWRPVFWLVFAWVAFQTVFTLLFGDETYYNRKVPLERQPERGTGHIQRLSRVGGIWGIRNHLGYFPTIANSYKRLFAALVKPLIFSTVVIYSVVFMWAIGINLCSGILLQTPREAGGYGLDQTTIGYIYFTPVVAIFIGEIVGHYLNDYIVAVYTRRHHGVFIPEARLWTAYVGATLMVPGLILTGQTLQHQLPYVGIIFGWGMHATGFMLVSVAIYAYLLDCYPSASGEVSALVNGGRAIAGFSIGYFQLAWGLKQGFDVSFGLQAVISFAAVVLIALTHIYGARIRHWSGPVKVYE